MLFLHPWGEDRPGVGLCSHQLKANGSSAPAGTRQKQSSSQLSFPLAELWAAGGSAQSSGPGGRKAALRSPQLLLSGRAFCKGRRPQSLHQNKKQHRGNGGGGEVPLAGLSSIPASSNHRGDGGASAWRTEIRKGAELHLPAESRPWKRGFRAAHRNGALREARGFRVWLEAPSSSPPPPLPANKKPPDRSRWCTAAHTHSFTCRRTLMVSAQVGRL